jgi:hypothetical protein
LSFLYNVSTQGANLVSCPAVVGEEVVAGTHPN